MGLPNASSCRDRLSLRLVEKFKENLKQYARLHLKTACFSFLLRAVFLHPVLSSQNCLVTNYLRRKVYLFST